MSLVRLSRDQSGSTAAEFGLVLPLLMLLLFGVIDTGRWIWTYNQAEKATQMGARFAIVADGIAGSAASSNGIYSSYLGVSGLTQGDVIPASAFGKITCTGSGSGATISATCVCTTAPCPSGSTTATTAAFTNVLTRMQRFLPELTASNLKVEYSSSGLGYAGSPTLPDLSPLVTVEISGMAFRPLTILAIKPVTMPSFTTTLSAEDLSGSVSN
ncbi:MAG TPA: TadE family protein [Sphingomicrobium sp.]|nr:TadE family protein [Sphingomicrobium sp.]